MRETIVTARKWGNSIGVTLPKELADKEKIRDCDRIIIKVKKIAPLKELFGTFTTKKSTQKIKEGMRKGWD